jgi:hypothetical protein
MSSSKEPKEEDQAELKRLNKPIYQWEKIVRNLPNADLVSLKNMLWITSLDAVQKDRLNFVLHEILEPDSKAIGMMPKDTVRKIEKDRLNPAVG